MSDELKHPLLDTFEQSPEQFVDAYAEMLKSASHKAMQKEIAKLEDEVERLQKAEADFHMAYRLKCDVETKAPHEEVERTRASLSAWKQAVIEKLVVSHCYKNAHEDDPEAAVNDLISWEVNVALDPCVSSAAAALVRTAIDCRTCMKASRLGHHCMSVAQCVNGDQYVRVSPPIQLWEKR